MTPGTLYGTCQAKDTIHKGAKPDASMADADLKKLVGLAAENLEGNLGMQLHSSSDSFGYWNMDLYGGFFLQARQSVMNPAHGQV